MEKNMSFKVSMIGLGIALNIVGAFIALNFKLPIYLDSIGTIMISFLMGPAAGIITGILGSVVSGVTFDIYSLYFAPVQIFTGFFAGLLYSKGWLKGVKMPIGVFFISTFSSLVGAVITAFVFGGITSSGSSYIVAVLSNLGVNKVVSVFIVQFLTDYADKFAACALMSTVVLRTTGSIKRKLIRG